MSDLNTKEEIATTCLRMIGRTPEEQIEITLGQQYAHYYQIWKTMRDVFGPEKTSAKVVGTEREGGLYSEVWQPTVTEGYKAILASLGVRDPKEADIPSLGKATEIFFEGVPALYETVENTPSRHVGNIRFCANPRYGPKDTFFDRCKYFQNEEAITEVNIGTAINSLLGESSKIRMRVERSICNGSDFCTMVIEKEGVSSSLLPVGKKPSAKEASIFEVLEEQQRSVAEQIVNSVKWFAGADLAFYKAVEKDYGIDKAQDVHSRVWTSYVASNLRRAMDAMQISEIKSVSTLGRIARFIYDDYLQPFKTVVDNEQRFVGLILMSPFVGYTLTSFGEKLGGAYHQALSRTSSKCVERMAEISGLKGVTGKQDKFLALGDDIDRIIFEEQS